jgi:hypothetical protein
LKTEKKAQEEMVGFALIIIIVAVILLIFLGFSLNKPQKETVESYEVESFIQAFLQYSTDCSSYRDSYPSIQTLIMQCNKDEPCLDKRDSCDVLNSVLSDLIQESWKVEEGTPVKGYQLSIKSDGEDLISIEKGSTTNNYKSAMQDFSKDGSLIEIFFTAYY